MNNVLYGIVGVVALLIGALLFSKLESPKPEFSLYYEEPRAIKPFVLTDHHNQKFTEKNLLNKWTWVFLGYTSCPDVCPTTLQALSFIYPQLQEISSQSQVLLVSVDPNRDTPDTLANYIKYFHKDFIAVSAGHEVLFPFARNMGLMYAINDDQTKEYYTVDHSSSMILINPQGQIAAIFQPHQVLGKLPVVNGDELLSDFQKIVNL